LSETFALSTSTKPYGLVADGPQRNSKIGWNVVIE
jgi:hypothetical protein